MTIAYDDVIRHEDTTANLPSTSRNGQVTFETDSQRRLFHATLDGTVNHWTPDENLTAALSAYTNAGLPSVANVKQALDALVLSTPVFPSTVLTGSLAGAITTFLFPSGFTRSNCVIASCMVKTVAAPPSDFYLSVPVFQSGGTGTYWINIGYAYNSGPTSVIAINMGADAAAVYGTGSYIVTLQRIS